MIEGVSLGLRGEIECEGDSLDLSFAVSGFQLEVQGMLARAVNVDLSSESRRTRAGGV
jgi:hypothetical protein